MGYKLISNWRKYGIWEITMFKYNINHQEFISYTIDESGKFIKKVFRTELIE